MSPPHRIHCASGGPRKRSTLKYLPAHRFIERAFSTSAVLTYSILLKAEGNGRWGVRRCRGLVSSPLRSLAPSPTPPQSSQCPREYGREVWSVGTMLSWTSAQPGSAELLN